MGFDPLKKHLREIKKEVKPAAAWQITAAVKQTNFLFLRTHTHTHK